MKTFWVEPMVGSSPKSRATSTFGSRSEGDDSQPGNDTHEKMTSSTHSSTHEDYWAGGASQSAFVNVDLDLEDGVTDLVDC
jgi:hypothetical protein